MVIYFPKINISYEGTPGTIYKYPINGHFPKNSISYQGTPGTTSKYLMYGHLTKSNISWPPNTVLIIPQPQSFANHLLETSVAG